MTEEEMYWIWLSNIEGIGPATFYRILAVFSEIGKACQNMKCIPKNVKIPQKVVDNLMRSSTLDFRDKILEKLEKYKIRVITRLNADYPVKLAEIDNPPPVLYFKGQMPKNTSKACGIVGSRKPTQAGYSAARKVASDLAKQDVVIISGLARGIDSAAHLGALNSGGTTVAILGCGLNIIYPPENKGLYDKICERGAVISEYPPDVEPKPQYFPLRNRIISGMSDALIVGEGGEKSGARITVDYALKQGKTVYLIPCDPKSSVADLPNYLLENGANILRHSLTVMENECWKIKQIIKDENSNLSLAANQQLIYQLLKREPLNANELSDETGLTIKELNLILTYMEMRDIIVPIEGDKYQLKYD